MSWTPKVNEKLAEAQPDVEMKGFRKGKVPMALLKKQFGQRLMGEAMQEAVDGAMSEHFEETGDRPALQPDVKMANEDWKEGDDVEVELSYEALPEIPDFDAKDIKLERLVVEGRRRRGGRGAGEPGRERPELRGHKDGAAEDGDQVSSTSSARSTARRSRAASAEDYPLVLGSGQLHPRLRGAAEGREGGRREGRQGHLPRGVPGRASGRQGSDLRVHGEGGEGAEAGRDRRRAGQAAMAPTTWRR